MISPLLPTSLTAKETFLQNKTKYKYFICLATIGIVCMHHTHQDVNLGGGTITANCWSCYIAFMASDEEMAIKKPQMVFWRLEQQATRIVYFQTLRLNVSIFPLSLSKFTKRTIHNNSIILHNNFKNLKNYLPLWEKKIFVFTFSVFFCISDRTYNLQFFLHRLVGRCCMWSPIIVIL